MGRWRGPTTRRCRRAWTLVATAAYVDPDFVQKAVRLVADHSTYFKSIVPLAENSRRARLNRAGGQHGGSQSARGSHDPRDNSGTIGLGWLANLRAAFGLTFQRQG